ncbi:hypothetical protein Pst134EA_031639 [Puccinia striiformis f. sp. tritici]|uniref:uncharacterized protein n=1 Tax=Puccinia striiformis f. sp. tritici TaxID=168172 RepID=UPI0020081578|nr:uncharacterized protein Pst134EA_031639 [Puccinia striiformis f. sp. tritici]KAH9442706.1 hypothetical protein Pst134EA_031639 [Puccinia striiformis f. sp. tritici]
MFDTPIVECTRRKLVLRCCIVSTGNEFGFEEGKEHTLASFQRRADGFRRCGLDSSNFHRSNHGDSHSLRMEDTAAPEMLRRTPSAWSTKPFKDQLILEDFMEKEFWRLVESPTETVEVEYVGPISTRQPMV